MPVRGYAQDACRTGAVFYAQSCFGIFLFIGFIQFCTESIEAIHHIQVPDEDSPVQPAELTQAETGDRKTELCRGRAASAISWWAGCDHFDVGWFDLGFVENALGNVDANPSRRIASRWRRSRTSSNPT
jgi:hypothetical protein